MTLREVSARQRPIRPTLADDLFPNLRESFRVRHPALVEPETRVRPK
jgi:hypothetical protein